MSAPHDPEHEAIEAQLGAYFDGQLAPDEERPVLDHLAGCERCQAALDDLMGLHVALARSPDVAAGGARPAPAPAPA
ncbi:MAG TPA: zf-HC2 domain-containing protein, partial [Kofleriaceae bacterium]|nr:zf-HC2 domain-containing protein [Kofleriaceae bacterium]